MSKLVSFYLQRSNEKISGANIRNACVAILLLLKVDDKFDNNSEFDGF